MTPEEVNFKIFCFVFLLFAMHRLNLESATEVRLKLEGQTFGSTHYRLLQLSGLIFHQQQQIDARYLHTKIGTEISYLLSLNNLWTR